jgi:hypothetical protein
MLTGIPLLYLGRTRFGSKWRKWISACISMVSSVALEVY